MATECRLSLHLHPYFVYVSSKALVSHSPEPSFFGDTISTRIMCAGPYVN